MGRAKSPENQLKILNSLSTSPSASPTAPPGRQEARHPVVQYRIEISFRERLHSEDRTRHGSANERCVDTRIPEPPDLSMLDGVEHGNVLACDGHERRPEMLGVSTVGRRLPADD